MDKRQPPCPSLLRQLILYKPDTGLLFWKERGPEHFDVDDPLRAANVFNAMHAGARAGSQGGKGYRVVGILGGPLLEHRVAWALHYGRWPRHSIDHINGDRTDNRIRNLRDVPVTENNRNRSVCRRNKSGKVGVAWSARKSKWVSRISTRGKTIHLGYFDALSEAVRAREAAEEMYGFHKNHGKQKPHHQAPMA